MKAALLLLAALGTASAAPAPSRFPPTRPVHVHIGALAWVHDDRGLPTLQGDRVRVHAAHACALLGGTCTTQNGTLLVNGQRVETSGGTAALKALTAALGLSVAWDARTKVATVALPARGFAFEAQNIALEREGGPLSSTPALRAMIGANQLSVFGTGPLNAFTLFTPGPKGTLTYRGSLAPSTPDNPGRAPCNGSICSLAFGPDGLSAPYGLAYVR